MHVISWEDAPEQLAEAARFFAATISADPSYISHGEIQGGLSLDGKSWAPDLDSRFVEDLSDPCEDQQVAVMRDGANRILAAAIVEWVSTPRVTFGVLADLAVDPTQRSTGIGARMLDFVEAEARAQGCRWLFLESGRENVRAHAFFERHGFSELSHVFIKPLA